MAASPLHRCGGCQASICDVASSYLPVVSLAATMTILVARVLRRLRRPRCADSRGHPAPAGRDVAPRPPLDPGRSAITHWCWGRTSRRKRADAQIDRQRVIATAMQPPDRVSPKACVRPSTRCPSSGAPGAPQRRRPLRQATALETAPLQTAAGGRSVSASYARGSSTSGLESPPSIGQYDVITGSRRKRAQSDGIPSASSAEIEPCKGRVVAGGVVEKKTLAQSRAGTMAAAGSEQTSTPKTGTLGRTQYCAELKHVHEVGERRQ